MSSATALDYLGGSAVFHQPINSMLDLNDLIRTGFPAATLKALKDRFQFTNRDLATALGSSEKTIERASSQALINPSISDRLYRLARICGLALEVMLDESHASTWLRTAQYGLGQRVPLTLLATDAGAEEVKAELLRIKYGFLA